MKRREFMTLLGGTVAAWPLAARERSSRKNGQIGFSYWARRRRYINE